MALPAIPQNVYVQQANGQVLISWDLVAGSTAYSVQRSTDGQTYVSVGTPSANSYLDTSVSVGIGYFYQVAATNGSGTGAYSVAQGPIVPTKPGQMTLGQLRLLSQQKADRVNSNFVTLPEWNTYINQSAFELYDLLVQKFGDDYFVQSYSFITTGTASYTLPDGTTNPAFYKLLGVDLGLGNNAFITLKKYEFIARNSYIYPQLTANMLGVAGMRYRLVGSSLNFIPTPAAGQVVQVWYVPRLTAMLQETDTCDGISGWTEYVCVDAAIKALQKEEGDVSVLMAQKQALLDRIEAAAENRDAGEPERISDTRRAVSLWGTGDGPVGGI
jgi:hypothetical protein